MRIVQLANFYGPRSGGLRTALHHLGAGYAALGHEVVLVVPGPRRIDELMPSGVRRITLPAAKIPGTGGYRAVDPGRVRALLAGLRPDRIEVSDRLTLRGMGRWAAEHGVPSVVISHERLDRLLHQFLLPDPVARRVADWANRRMAASYDTVVCTTGFAREEFDRIGSRNVVQVPLGVDLATFAPATPRCVPSWPGVLRCCWCTAGGCRRRSRLWRRWPRAPPSWCRGPRRCARSSARPAAPPSLITPRPSRLRSAGCSMHPSRPAGQQPAPSNSPGRRQ